MNTLLTVLSVLIIVMFLASIGLSVYQRKRASKPSINIRGGAIDWAQVTETKPGHISFLNPEGREVSLVYRDTPAHELKLESIRRNGNSETRDYATIETEVVGSEASVPRLAGATLRSVSFDTDYEGQPYVRLNFGKGHYLFPSENQSVKVAITKATVENTRPA